MRNESGFTLIEIIVSLVLVGMMAAIAGMGIVTGTKGYLLAKENSHMAQKGQLAMARIQRELMELTGIAARQADPAFIIYNNTTGRHAIARDGVYVKMYDLASGAVTLPVNAGDILVDNVNNFTLDYHQGANAWGGVNIQLLSAIQADLALDRSDGSGNPVTFTTTVNPRNTNNYGGVPPDITPFTAHNYACFVATAAYGDFHPPTVLLFSFSIVAVVFLSLNRKAGKLKGLEVWKLKNLSASWLYSLLASKPPGLPTSQPPSLPAVLLRQNKGNVLIGLIVTMMIFAALGAGMVAMTGTSTSSQVTANTTSKAYYLAESGFRYAASQYLNATDILPPNGEIEDDRNRELIALDGSTFTFVNPDERFSLEVYSYYFITTALFPAGSMSIVTTFAGQRPTDFTMPATNGRLEIENRIYSYSTYNVVTGNFALNSPLIDPIADRMNVLPVGIPSGAVNMTNGGDLTLTDASFFPAITGKFMINGIAYTYQTRNGNTLENITDANQPNRVFTLPVNATTNLILRPYLKVHSTGTVGQGVQAASRLIVYNVPIPDSPTEGVLVEFHDRLDDTSHLNASTWGTHAAQNVGGDFALKVTNTTSEGIIEKSLIGLNWQSTDANLGSAHSLSGRFLSYDAQVKVGFDPSTYPDANDADYAAGLSFRLDESNNSYGVSFMEADSDSGSAIDPDIIPPGNYDVPMIVLWQQTNSGADRDWLAYKYLTGPVIGSDNMENGPGGWFGNIPPWSLDDTSVAHSGTWYWTDSPGGNYLDNEDAELISPLLDLTGQTSAVLTFWHKYDFFDAGDRGRVYINGNEIASFVGPGTQNDWVKFAIDISEYIPNNVRIAFRIDTDGSGTADGWHIDDVAISEGFPVNESTLLVRIKEAAELRFNSGGTTEIENGDIITQANGAHGTVVGNPVLSSGSWAAGNAVGIITINKVSGTFADGQALLVGGSNLATSLGFTDRNNYIKVFYGNITGYGTANNDPFDMERLPNLRTEVHWPTDEIAGWSAERDFFTLVQWDGVNSVDIIDSIDEPGVIVLGTESSLFTPDSGILSYNRPELGLHTFGHGSTNVYFDDFAIQLEIATGSGFLTPIQE